MADEKINSLLNNIRGQSAHFIGPNVHRQVTSCAYPRQWINALERYEELLRTEKSMKQFYLDLTVTMLVKRCYSTEIYFVLPVPETISEDYTDKIRFQQSFLGVSKRNLQKFVSCFIEVYNMHPPPHADIVLGKVESLYDSLTQFVAGEFESRSDGVYYKRDPNLNIGDKIHDIVDDWLRSAVLDETCEKSVILAPGLSFLGVGHCYWLWLHLTAAAIETSITVSDFMSILYTLDMFVYCGSCSEHFRTHRGVLFQPDRSTGGIISTYTPQDAVYFLHNIVNKETNAQIMPHSIKDDYKSFWEKAKLQVVW